MTPNQAFEASVVTVQTVIDLAPISGDDLRRPTPCRDFDVAALTAHILDTHDLLLTAAGGSSAGDDGSFSERHRRVATASIAQWANRGTGGSIDVGGNELPAAFGLSLHTLETYVHGWDLAQGLGRPFEPSDALTETVWAIAREIVSDDLRGDGAPYGAAVEVGADAAVVDRIVAHTGRDPHRSVHPSTQHQGESHV